MHSAGVRALYANGVVLHSPGLVAGGLPEATYGRVRRKIAPLPQRGCVRLHANRWSLPDRQSMADGVAA